MKIDRVLMLVGGAALLASLGGCPLPFVAEGRLVAGAECTLFETDNGQRYVLDNQGTFDVGDRVRVAGILDANCVTTCQEGDGCVRGNSISAAANDFDACGDLVQGVTCVLFETDDGKRYVLEQRGGFQVGDRVRVIGKRNEDCVTICIQGDGCIDDNTIHACDD